MNAFLDTELEQTICFDSPLDAETFANRKSAIFLILPEEDQTKNIMAGLMIQNLSWELFSVTDENEGRLKNRDPPMRTRLRLFLDWGITFGEPYQTPEHGQRKVYSAGRQELEAAIQNRCWMWMLSPGMGRICIPAGTV